MTDAIKKRGLPLFLGLCLLMGGASNGGFLENFLLQIGGIILAVLAITSRPDGAEATLDRFLPWILLFWACIVAVQFIPLPVSLWAALPGRLELTEELALLGVEPAPAMVTLSYHDSFSSLAWALPALGFAVALAAQKDLHERSLALALITCAFLAIALGLIQFLGDPQSAAYLYRITNRGLMVGFFANANHMATLLLVTLPFLAALTRSLMDERGHQRRELLIIWILLAGFIVIGLALVGSLTGYALAAPVIALSAVIMFPRAGRLLKMAIIPAVALGAAIIALTDEGGNVFAEEDTLSQRDRQQIFSTTIAAAQDFWPVGTGLGTFRDIYDNYEEQDAVDRVYVNHAHSDYLEIGLEFGLAGLIGIIAFVAWWLWRLRTLWPVMARQPFTQAAAIGSGIILVHSLWDYPLRTAALSSVFALSCVILARAAVARSTRS